MVGVILAAGKGARMYPFSERSPKPILPILNRPLLSHQIEVMRECGITEVHIVVGHLGYQVASTFGDGSQYGVKIHFVEQESTLGLAHAVGALESRVQVPFLLMLGDIYFHLKAPLRPLCDEVLGGKINANLVSMYERSEEHMSELQSRLHLVCRLLLEKKKNNTCPTKHGQFRSLKFNIAAIYFCVSHFRDFRCL